ncbi:uncharacterized protein LOC122700729 [Cervus elaphus]|uniref:uncharacterized protein LOC122700729 n=1 Tax=Cervus elaphus TaxID=9860 RepID=UPI001CC303FE|nr:uncharacterized protein LOC122700729 [Cervus elaphus]
MGPSPLTAGKADTEAETGAGTGRNEDTATWLLPAHGQRPRSTSRGLQPSDGGPALLHVPTVTTAHGFQVLAQRPQVLSAEAPLWRTSPETPADPSWILDQPEIPGTPPHGRFQNLSKTRKLRSREVDQRVLGHRAGVLAQGVGCLQHHLPPTPILCSEAHHVGAESLPPPAPGALTPPRSTSDTAEPCSPPGLSRCGWPPPGSWPVTQERTPIPHGHECKNKKLWSTLQMGGGGEKGSSIPGAVGLSSGWPR